MARVLIAGGSGFIGRACVSDLLARGDEVTVLTRGEAGVREGQYYQHFEPSDIAGAHFVGDFDVVINLAGEQAVGVRYTDAVKERITRSRVDSTRWLVRGIERAEHKPRVFVCASGTGYYGSSLSTERVDETAAAGGDFLALVCMAWEGAAVQAEASGVRVVRARISPVLSEKGGALESLLRPFKLFVGGPIASGKQGFPWIHLDDCVAALRRCIDDSALAGAVNVCAPEPVSNAELSKVVGELLGRPSFLKAPSFALKALFGEGAEPLVGGQYAVPRALERVGFQFRYRTVRAALSAILAAQRCAILAAQVADALSPLVLGSAGGSSARPERVVRVLGTLTRRNAVRVIEPIAQIYQLATRRAEGPRREVIWRVFQHGFANGAGDPHAPSIAQNRP